MDYIYFKRTFNYTISNIDESCQNNDGCEFDKLHGDTLNGGENIMDTLTKTVMAHLQHKLPEEVVSCLVRTRTFIRFNQINKKINDNVHIKNKNKFKKFTV